MTNRDRSPNYRDMRDRADYGTDAPHNRRDGAYRDDYQVMRDDRRGYREVRDERMVFSADTRDDDLIYERRDDRERFYRDDNRVMGDYGRRDMDDRYRSMDDRYGDTRYRNQDRDVTVYGADRDRYGTPTREGTGWHDDRASGAFNEERYMDRYATDRRGSQRSNLGEGNSYQRGLGGMGAYNPDRRYEDRGGHEGLGMSMRDQQRRVNQRGEGFDDGLFVDRDMGTSRARSSYSDRDMGNLERDPYGRGETMRGRPTGDWTGARGDQRDGFVVHANPDMNRNRAMSEGYGGTSGQSYDGTQRRMYGGTTGGMYREGQESRGLHYGRGPKNYQRDNQRVQEDVCEQLTYHHDVDATHIDVKVENGEVTLSGTVTDRRQKRLAADIAEDVRGVKDVHNQIRIQQNQAEGSVLSTTAMSGGDSTNMTTVGTTTSSDTTTQRTSKTSDNTR